MLYTNYSIFLFPSLLLSLSPTLELSATVFSMALSRAQCVAVSCVAGTLLGHLQARGMLPLAYRPL